MAAETTPPLSDTQKPWSGHPSCGRPADYLPSGTVGQWHPVTGQWWNELQGGDPKTDQVTQGADSKLPGWQPKEKAAQLPEKGGTLETAWVASVQKKGGAPKTPAYEGEGTQEPLASRRHWLLQVVAATAGANPTETTTRARGTETGRRRTTKGSSCRTRARKARRVTCRSKCQERQTAEEREHKVRITGLEPQGGT